MAHRLIGISLISEAVLLRASTAAVMVQTLSFAVRMTAVAACVITNIFYSQCFANRRCISSQHSPSAGKHRSIAPSFGIDAASATPACVNGDTQPFRSGLATETTTIVF
ncbi:hypothetical protein [Dyella terrae]|uniref:hypothetical protein n=1 Tax=Dyella terrae TaxID=522259 RepID=UPI001EFEEF82|nr:hypothetical protein [Dyella terrae]ULU27134.1 hypothetical protein DYST_04088 [Dyella terrae]